jgi:heme A synthase
MAIFTAWPEIGGPAALELMHWGWKLGFSVTLAAATVSFTASMVSEEKAANARTFGWLAGILTIVMAMGVVTYYYTLQEETGESDEPSATVSIYYRFTPGPGGRS